MASVKISKNGMEKEVSVSAFENFFKNSGWEIAGDKKPATSQSKKEEKVKEVVEEPVENNSDDEWDEVLEDEEIEKPLSEMSKKELAEYAENNGISLAGLSTAAQYRQAIQDNMKEE